MSLSTHYPVVGLCVLSHLLKENLQCGLIESLIYGYSDKLLGVILLLCSFNSMTILSFAPKNNPYTREISPGLTQKTQLPTSSSYQFVHLLCSLGCNETI